MMLVKSFPEIFSGGLSHRLSGDIRQVIIFVVRLMVSPHRENNLEPFCSERSNCLMGTVTFSSLIPIVLVRPFTSRARIKGKPVHGVAQMLVAREPKLDRTTLATGFGYGHRSRLGLKMPEGVPSTFGIAQLSQTIGIVVPLFAPGSVVAILAAGRSAKKPSTSWA